MSFSFYGQEQSLRLPALLNWQTTLLVNDIEAIAQRLRLHRAIFISPNVVAIPGQILGFQKGVLLRDPDGHSLRLVEK